jgi:hypothetical protein
MRLNVILAPSDEGGFTAYVPALYLEPVDDLAGRPGVEIQELVV